jgi:NAD(P)-dependent dehydrogenase (short-subunit alcohol dehydrogenase family)
MSEVLVLVGAGPGLGAAIAQRFAGEGWSIGLLAHRADVVDAERADLVPTGVTVATAVGDVTDRASMRDAMTTLTAELGAPTAVVYNASMYQAESVLELTAEGLRRALDLHVIGALSTAQCAVTAMRPAGRGVVIFTINNLALEPHAEAAAMAVGKGAQRNLALSLEQELVGTGIEVGILRIAGVIKAATAFDPARIAEAYWAIATQEPGRFVRDHVFDGT